MPGTPRPGLATIIARGLDGLGKFGPNRENSEARNKKARPKPGLSRPLGIFVSEISERTFHAGLRFR